MSYHLFKVLHLLGIFLLFAALGAAALRAYTPGPPPVRDRGSRLIAITHGLALLILLLSGFAILGARQWGFDGWVWAKLAIWLVMGGLVAVIRRSPSSAGWIWWLLPALGVVAAWLAIYKPF